MNAKGQHRKGIIAVCGALLLLGLMGSLACADGLPPPTPLDPETELYRPSSSTPYTVGLPSDVGYTKQFWTDYAITGDFTGTVTASVWKNTAGELAFAYQVQRDSGGSTAAMVSFGIGGTGNPWLGWKINWAGSDDSGTSTPTSSGWTDGSPAVLGRNPTADFGESVYALLKITQGTYLKQGQSSAVFWFATNATKYQETDFSIQDSGAVGSSKGYAPVPGPTTLLGLVGLSGMGFVMTWRRKKTA